MSNTKEKLSKSTIITVLTAIIIPITVYFGTKYMNERYYFLSMIVIFEILLSFFALFEGRKPQARQLVVIAVFTAITVAGRLLLAPFQFVKPVTALVIIAGVYLGGEAGFLVGAMTAFVSNFYFSQGIWTPWQMLVWGIVGFLAGALFKKGRLSKNIITLPLFGFFVTFIVYGGIMNPASYIMMNMELNFKTLIACYHLGFPIDLIHAVSTTVFLFLLAKPVGEILDRIKTKYDLS